MADAIDIFLGEIKCTLERFKPKPGDVFVFTVPNEMPESFFDRLQSVADQLPCKILVVAGEAKIELASAVETTAHTGLAS